MQKLELKEINGWNVSEIDAKVNELRRNLFEYRMQMTTSGLEKPHFVKVAKKNIAKLLTVKASKKGE